MESLYPFIEDEAQWLILYSKVMMIAGELMTLWVYRGHITTYVFALDGFTPDDQEPGKLTIADAYSEWNQHEPKSTGFSKAMG